jgi:hypothetical protein
MVEKRENKENRKRERERPKKEKKHARRRVKNPIFFRFAIVYAGTAFPFV